MIHEMVALTKEQLDELLTTPDDVVAFLVRQDERRDECSLYKWWHVMHFLLNGEPWGGDPPWRWAVFGDRELGTVDLGYGPALYLLPAQVAEVAEALSQLPVDEVMENYDVAAMQEAELYCCPEEGDEAARAETCRNYKELVAFYQRTAKEGRGVVAWLS